MRSRSIWPARSICWLAYWAADLGRAGFQLLARGLPPLAIGALTVGLAPPGSWTAYPLGLLSLLLGISISFLLRFGVNLSAFWLLDVRGFIWLQFVFAGPAQRPLRPGAPLPATGCSTIAYATPFPAIFQTPIDVLSGRVLGGRRAGGSSPSSSAGSSDSCWWSGSP